MGRTGDRLFSCCILLIISLPAGAQQTPIRLVNGKDVFEGRLEILHDGVWGTVCDDNWALQNAQVVCRQLGFAGVMEDGALVKFGNGSDTGKIWLDDVTCSGEETDLSQCSFPDWGTHNCQHEEDVGVRCDMEVTLQKEFRFPHRSGWPERLGALFESGVQCDLDISVMEDGRLVEAICAHRLILRMNPNIRDSQKALVINTTRGCSQYARAFIRYFYTGGISFNHTSCICVLKMAADWGLGEFQNETVNIIKSLLSQDHTFQAVRSVYDYALSPFDEDVMNILIHYLAWNFKRLVGTTSWKSLPLGLVEALLASSDLVVGRETVVLLGLEEWAREQGMTDVPQNLLKLVRFPMIPAKDLNLLKDSRYHAGKFQGFQFQVVPYDLQNIRMAANSFTPRMYTDTPWSYKINYYTVELLRSKSNMTMFEFHTPFHSSAHFAYSKANWELSLNINQSRCSDTPLDVEDLNLVLNVTMEDTGDQLQNCIAFSNKLILQCEGMYTVRVDDFIHDTTGNFFYRPSQAGVVFPCPSNQISYILVIRSECKPF